MSIVAVLAAALGATGSDLRAWTVADVSGAQVGADERAYPIPPADGVTIDRDAQVILVRYAGVVYAFNLACPHENTALRWRQADGRFQCPRHESKYRPDGVFMEGRATRNMDRLPVRRDGANVVVNVALVIRSDESPEAWTAAAVKIS